MYSPVLRNRLKELKLKKPGHVLCISNPPLSLSLLRDCHWCRWFTPCKEYCAEHCFVRLTLSTICILVMFFFLPLPLSLSLSLSYSLGYQQCMHAKQQRRELGSRIHITYAKGDEARDVTSLYVFLLPSFWEEQGRISDNERWISRSLSLSLHWINTWKWKHCGGVKCEGEDEIEKRKP